MKIIHKSKDYLNPAAWNIPVLARSVSRLSSSRQSKNRRGSLITFGLRYRQERHRGGGSGVCSLFYYRIVSMN